MMNFAKPISSLNVIRDHRLGVGSTAVEIWGQEGNGGAVVEGEQETTEALVVAGQNFLGKVDLGDK
jgi:hypothetical protein